MFNNVGEKIKALAYISAALGILASLITSLALWCVNYPFYIGFIVLLGGSIVSYIFSIILYELGELIVQTTDIAKGNKRMQMLSVCEKNTDSGDSKQEAVQQIYNKIVNDYEQTECTTDEAEEFENTAQADECPCCFAKISPNDTECPNCGYKLK